MMALPSRERIAAMLLADEAETVRSLVDEARLAPVHATAWGLMLTGRFVELGKDATTDIGGYLRRLVSRSGEPFIRNAMKQAMRIMGRQFVLGRTINEAIDIAQPLEGEGYRFSYDMLGEAAFTMADAERYLTAYREALRAVGRN